MFRVIDSFASESWSFAGFKSANRFMLTLFAERYRDNAHCMDFTIDSKRKRVWLLVHDQNARSEDRAIRNESVFIVKTRLCKPLWLCKSSKSYTCSDWV